MCLLSGVVASEGLTPPGGDWTLLVAVEGISRLLIYKYYYGLHYVPGGYTFVGDMRFPGLISEVDPWLPNDRSYKEVGRAPTPLCGHVLRLA